MRGRRNPEAHIDLGLAISAATLKPGQCRTVRELADFCGVRPGTIQYYEAKALRKARRAFERICGMNPG